ncbi:MAG: TlpA family protein disulfide reductase, partial [bacterium]|nr:TlpA family protein disulfide reductase [bacterium]
NEGIAVTDNEGQKKLLEKTAAHLEYIGKKAFPVTTEDWLNTEKPLDLKNMKGQVVVISFWAPWCPSCRALMPTLVDMYNGNKDKGFTIIGYTRYYGKYRDDEVDKGKVPKEEELELIKKYMERNNVSYPTAVTEEKNIFTDYKIAGLPTLIFIDKKGNIDYTKIGSGSEQFLKDKVKALIEQ